MNKTELVEAIASSTELTKTDVDKVVTALVEVVTDALAKGDKVSLKGFGNFEVRTRSERTGRNPRTGETMTIAASKASGGQQFLHHCGGKDLPGNTSWCCYCDRHIEGIWRF